MKKFIVVILLIAVGGLILLLTKTYLNGEMDITKMSNLEKKWHVEITNSNINIREEPNAFSSLLGKVEKGEKYEVLDINLENGRFFWYKIKMSGNKTGWIASDRSSPYLIDHNNPTDVATPVLKFFETVYYVNSIEDIDYDHLEVWDDKEGFEVTHKVYKEIKDDGEYQFWIVYKVEDAVGKTTSKTQKIVFINEPKDSEVLDFNDFIK